MKARPGSGRVRGAVFILLLSPLFRAPAPARADEPSVSFDDRVDLDGLLQLTVSTAPPGFVRPTEDFAARALPPGPWAVPASTVPFGERAQVLMRLGPAPELRGADVPETIAASVGSRAEVGRWLDSLRALARSTAAVEALAAERRELAPELESFRAKLSSGAFVASIEEYTGLPLPGPHRLILSPFHVASGVANVVAERDDGGVAVTSLFGPSREGSTPEYWSARVPGTLWHEEAHGITDPLAIAWAARIERARPADAGDVCYGEWRQCVREHVVRAVMLRLMERRLGPDAAAEQLAFEHASRYRFRWLLAMVERLKEYEGDRARWPTLADFYPRLLDAIKEEPADAGPPFSPERETPRARARLAALARSALPRMRDQAARAHLERAAQLAAARIDAPGGTGAPSGSRPAAGLAARGVSAFAAGRRDEALRLFEAALRLDPRDAEAEMSRALILELLGRRDEAAAGYGRAADSARRRPETFPAHVLADALASRGRLRLAAGRRDEARRDLEAALKAAPRDWDGRAEAETLLGRSR